MPCLGYHFLLLFKLWWYPILCKTMYLRIILRGPVWYMGPTEITVSPDTYMVSSPWFDRNLIVVLVFYCYRSPKVLSVGFCGRSGGFGICGGGSSWPVISCLRFPNRPVVSASFSRIFPLDMWRFQAVIAAHYSICKDGWRWLHLLDTYTCSLDDDETNE